ncbi:DUF3093 domain-containing protein [Cellulosimicrobium sp. CUA-896]|uniref:DUF3093 domain-containing protein n=1 Tax=Cellulosimicrobium sp. CUA-896 TaxID=1517881 RepID=UPI000959E913|nr:DUF3093 domain-containing protein [Cellulosimicrobium sp. CUA-896]OLT53067.1 hypothetical protein BJF88_01515 [Cellulosimicrobium sp. CUA-896]
MTDAADPSPRPSAPTDPTGASFSERVLPGPGGWLAALAFAAVLAVAVWPASPPVGVAVGVVAAAAGLAALWWTSPVVAVHDGTFRAGRAVVPVPLLGAATALDAEAMRGELGPRLDARAYVCLRAWARTGVLVPLEDPQDPTPYWLVSTRRPHDLVDALRAGR